MSFKLLEGMQLGVATAATQIEGGNRQNTWYDWFLKGHIKDGSDPSIATNHYELYAEDAKLMREMGIEIYRLGIEWARLEPENGVFDESEFQHYKNELRLLKDYGIEPLVTLHHFTDPLWFAEMGAFENPACIDIFLRFVKKVVEEFRDLSSEYITINEPNVYAVYGWFFGDFPPGKKSFNATFKVLNNLCECHVKAYRLIHELREKMGYSDTKVGYAHHMRVFVPKNRGNLFHRACTPILRRLFQSAISKSFLTGRACAPLRSVRGAGKGPFCDFHAVNYYSRSAVSGFKEEYLENVPVNDLGWEIYPEGIAMTARELYKLAPLPIYITENGTCDNEDAYRSRYICEHIEALCKSGLPVKRYYHWCFTDNFEWNDGFSARFGIVHTDFDTQRRTVKKSGEFYKKMIQERGVTEEMYQEYCDVPYRTNGTIKSEPSQTASVTL
jgi:beta-glucosidase